MLFKKSLVVVALISFSFIAKAVEIVRFDIQSNGSSYVVDIELYDAITPITVTNFLKYVEDVPGISGGRYDGSFFHRKLDNFVLQGGGYTFDSSLGDFIFDAANVIYSGGLQRIETFPPIINEFQGAGLSNLRGTIAMAKSPGDPNSATSQWFINLGDNSANLDQQNDGFTVFGRVLDNGMDNIDLISTIPVFDITAIHPVFTDIPLSTYVSGNMVLQDNLVRINAVTRIQRPILQASSDRIDFGLVPVGQTATYSVTLKNVGNADLVMDNLSVAQLVAPFNISFEDCSNNTLRPVTPLNEDFCTITVDFSPTDISTQQTRLSITPSTNPYGLNFFIDAAAEGVPSTPVVYIEGQITSVDYSDIALNVQTTKSIVIQNRGGGALTFSSLTISGQDASLFSLDSGCDNTISLAVAETCILGITVNPDTEGLKTASLAISTNAGTINLPLLANSLGSNIEVVSDLYLGKTSVGIPISNGVLVTNAGMADLVISNVSLIEGDIGDFSIDTSNCNSGLIAGRQCVILIDVDPLTDGSKYARLSINTNDPNKPTVFINISADVFSPDIDAVTEVFVGTAQINGSSIFTQFKVINKAAGPLQIDSFNLLGTDANAFAIGSDCPGLSPDSSILPLELNEECTIAVRFLTTSKGLHNAVLELVSNDPDENIFSVALTAYGDLDSDGVAFDEERQGPNIGDGNNDAIQDDIQNNVTSFLANSGEYITIASPSGTLLSNVSTVENPAVDLSPQSIRFDHGFFKFNILAPGAVPNAVIQLGLFLPVGAPSDQFYKYGPTPDNPLAHWYKFDYDGITGAQYFGDVAISPPGGGPAITKSFFILSFVDGERGDDDLTVNGEIVAVGAPGAIDNAPEGAAGTVSYWWLLTICGLLCLRCSFYYRSNSLN